MHLFHPKTEINSFQASVNKDKFQTVTFGAYFLLYTRYCSISQPPAKYQLLTYLVKYYPRDFIRRRLVAALPGDLIMFSHL